MENSQNSISFENSVWDLHIHTCKCPKGSSDFSKMSLDEYIDAITSVFKKHHDLSMISFTDHNKINADVYEAFNAQKTGIKLIIGVEVDVYLNEVDVATKQFKHVIFYFDDEKFDLKKDSDIINSHLENNPVILHSFLDFLITEVKVPFLISPHFLKQGKRGIEYNWDEDSTKKNIDKYIDQMCCFWEASNNSSIQRAIDLLNEFDKGDRVSIISFSDSNNLLKLENYLNNPCQYFNSLPTFNGLRLAGSDCRRISFSKSYLSSEDKACRLGKITQGKNNVIYLSPGLNSIVGGRGSGKSLLIDGISYFLKQKETEEIFDDSFERLEYIAKLDYRVFDLNGSDLTNHSFQFDYFNQGFAQELFKKNSDLMSSHYFKDKFDSLKRFDPNEIKTKILDEIKIDDCTERNLENITGLDAKIVLINDGKTNIKFKKPEKLISSIDYPKYKDMIEYLQDEEFLPEQLKNNLNIHKAMDFLIKTIYEETNKKNVHFIHNNLKTNIVEKYKKILNDNNKQKRDKEKIIELLKLSIQQKFKKTNKRVCLMNKIISAATLNFSDRDFVESNGYGGRKFIFQRKLVCQNLLEYVFNEFQVYFDSNKLKKLNIDKKKFTDLYKLIEVYCFYCDDFILETKNADSMDSEFEKLLSYKVEVVDEIIVKDNDNEQNLKNVSPGTRANMLLEYIVFNETNKPLLIDQPEDNIDNETIYNQLTNWFSSLKKKRQVIVVTHDANIVVNSDSENVIICSQKSNDIFDYKSGALEFGKTLDEISVLLDGGKRAIERRLLKYGE